MPLPGDPATAQSSPDPGKTPHSQRDSSATHVPGRSVGKGTSTAALSADVDQQSTV